jgi:hypothetical protein
MRELMNRIWYYQSSVISPDNSTPADMPVCVPD